MKLCPNEFGYDEAIDYKSDDLAEALAAVCPQGIDVYFDNTAGQRLGLCAAGHWTSCSDLRHCIDCQLDPLPQVPRVERHVHVKRARLSGLLIFDYAHRVEEGIARLADWVRQGKLRYRED